VNESVETGIAQATNNNNNNESGIHPLNFNQVQQCQSSL
jgi:hypothetical protein